jgi:hypothetical protein
MDASILLASMLLVQAPDGLDVHRPPTAGTELAVDWVRFGSGEWHNGEFKSLRNRTLEFDADQTGLDAHDWDDVTDLYLPNPVEFVFEGPIRMVGSGHVGPDEVELEETTGESVTLPRSQLLRIVRTDGREISRWSFESTIGIDVRQGNTQQASITGDAALLRKGSLTRFKLEYRGSVGAARQQITPGDDTTPPETDVRLTTNRHRGASRYDRYITNYFFWRIMDVYALYDEFQDTEIETLPTTALGWTAIDAPNLSLDLSVGAAYKHTSFISDAPSVNTGGPGFGIELAYDVTSDVEFKLQERAFVDIGYRNPRNQSQATTTVELDIEITSIFELDLKFIHDIVAEPLGINPITGEPVKSNDFQYVVGLGIDLGS